jgi:hypothetical protein
MASRTRHWSDWIVVAALLPPLVTYTAGTLVASGLQCDRAARWCRIRAFDCGAIARAALGGQLPP